jgi:hypothetical protein
LTQNSPAFLARLPGTGAIAARGTITGFDIGFADRTDDTAIHDILPDGTGIYRFTIVADGLPAGFRVKLRTHHQGAAFPNGSRDLELTAADFDANGIATVEVIYPPGSEPRVCHTAQVVDQAGNTYNGSSSQLFNIPPDNRVEITTDPRLRVNDNHDHMDGTVEDRDLNIHPIQGDENDLRRVTLYAANCRTDSDAYAEFTLLNPGALSSSYWVDKNKNLSYPVVWSKSLAPGEEWQQEFWVEGIAPSQAKDNIHWKGTITYGDPHEVKATVYQLDLDVDSDNDGNIEETDDKREESTDPYKPGVILVTQLDRDSDGDGVPDFADGLGLPARYGVDSDSGLSDMCGENCQLEMMRLKLPTPLDPLGAVLVFDYTASIPRLKSDPDGGDIEVQGAGTLAVDANPSATPPVTAQAASPRTYKVDQAGLRVWTVDGSARQAGAGKSVVKGGKFVPAGVSIPWRNLAAACGVEAANLSSTRELSLYLEYVEDGLNPVLAGQQQIIEIREIAESGSLALDRIHALPVLLDLDVTNDGHLSGPNDGITRYLPGYEGTQPELHTGATFEDASYAGPQPMRIVLMGLGSQRAGGLSMAEIFPTNYQGFCGNGAIQQETISPRDDDLSFSDSGNQRTINQATVLATTIELPFYCKDYGAHATVAVQLKMSGQTLPLLPKFRFEVPNDPSEDWLADHWQNDQIDAWNKQFREQRRKTAEEKKSITLDYGPMLGDEQFADAEWADSDGPGPSVAMANYGDGLTAIKEYRGYILDGGPYQEVPVHKHKRLSLARKELLAECSEMDGIRDVGSGQLTDPNTGNPTDPGNQANFLAQGYDLTATMEKVSWFYRNEQVGGVMDLYWVRDRLVDEDPVVVYQDWTTRPSAYRHQGVYWNEDTNQWDIGWLSITADSKLERQDSELHRRLFRGVGVLANNGNRNVACTDFMRMAFQGRRGKIINSGEAWRTGSDFAEGIGENKGVAKNQEGARIFVNSMSEEKPYSPDQFFGKLSWSMAHEFGHLYIIGQEDSPMTPSDHTYLTGSLMGSADSLDACSFHEKEIKYSNLPWRASTGP